MRHRIKVIQQGSWYELVKSINPATGRHYYEIRVNGRNFFKKISANTYDLNILDQVREHFDPHHTRGGRWSTKWKFRNREEAEKLITMALLKFGA